MTMTHGAELAIIPIVATGTLVAMTFTPSEITALTIASATLLGAVFSGVALIITTLRSTRQRVDEAVTKVQETAVKVAENTALTETVKAKVDIVETKVDGTASRADAREDLQKEQIASLQKELIWMRERLGEQKQDAALLAQAKASMMQVTVPISATNSTVNGAEESLDNIDAHTEAIEKNTAKTEKKIDQLKDKP